jgi:hypothetical protein
MSAGGLTEEEVEGIRTGAIPDPTVGQVAALAAVFGVEPSYLVGRKEPPSLDAELMDAMRDAATREITREALRLCRSARRRSSSASSGSSGRFARRRHEKKRTQQECRVRSGVSPMF